MSKVRRAQHAARRRPQHGEWALPPAYRGAPPPMPRWRLDLRVSRGRGERIVAHWRPVDLRGLES